MRFHRLGRWWKRGEGITFRWGVRLGGSFFGDGDMIGRIYGQALVSFITSQSGGTIFSDR